MLTISITFTRAATGASTPRAAFSTYWLLVFAVAILDDAERREKEQRRKRKRDATVPRKPKRPCGPCP